MMGQSLVALLALVGSRRTTLQELRNKTKLTPVAFENLLGWLKREDMVEIVHSQEGGGFDERVAMTDSGESALISMLERTCELPELR
jgi:hypothetical protein